MGKEFSADKFIKTGGLATEYLMGDGSVTTGGGGGSGTVTNVSAITIGTTGTDISSTVATPTTTPLITLNIPTASATNRGVLSTTDWSAFNGKQSALSGTGIVKSTAGVISYDSSIYITGNQTITLSGVITGSGTTTITTTLANSIVGVNNLSATGTPSATTYLRGDNTWGTPAGGGTVTGTSTSGYVSFWNTTTSILGSSNLYWDDINNNLGIGTIPDSSTELHIKNTVSAAYFRIQGLGDVDNYVALELWDSTGASKWQFAHKLISPFNKSFAFSHWNGSSWIQPMTITDSGRTLIGTLIDDGSTQLQIGGAIKATTPTFTAGIANSELSNGVTNTNSASQSQATVAGTSYYITKSNLLMPSTYKVGIIVGTVFKWRVAMTKTAVGTGTFLIKIYRGTNGTTADTLDVNQSIGTQTAVVDNMMVDVTVTVTTAGASGSYYWSIVPCNKAVTATGFGVATGTGAYFSGTVSAVNLTTASLQFGIGFSSTTGTPTIAIPMVQASAINVS